MVDDLNTYRMALEDFRKQRSRAAMQTLWGGVTGKSLDLLPFDEISSKLHATSKTDRGLQEIPLDAIVGSVGRYDDFNRNFLPLIDSDIDRWARVKTVMTSATSTGVPPISVYKIGDAYFVLDGNHRVSIAKQMEMETIEAYVTEIKTRVPIGPEISPEDLILKEEYVNFLEQTQLDSILPEVDFSLTFPGQYELLKEHIRVHRHYMGITDMREISYEEAVHHWYEHVYKPVVEVIQESGLLQEFKGKTETDLYLWILDHQTQIQSQLGWQVRTENVAEDLAVKEGKQISSVTPKAEQHIEQVLSSDEMLTEAETHRQLHPIDVTDCLFQDILVAISGLEDGWDALEQAIRIRRCGNGEIRGLHVLTDEEFDAEKVNALKTRFSTRLAQDGIPGLLSVEKGEISKILSSRSYLNDLLVLKLNYPPAGSLFDRWSSGFSSILRNSKRPVLVVREKLSVMDRLLLAYDASPKSKEALYISAYFASRYRSFLKIITIDNGSKSMEQEIDKTKSYLTKLGVDFDYAIQKGDVPGLVTSSINECNANILILGGYGHSSLLEIVFGSAVDAILRKISIPALICQ